MPDGRSDLMHRADGSAFRTDQCRSLMAAWLDWRGQNRLPARGDMDLSRITPLLPYVILLEVRSPDEHIIRLAGTAIGRALGDNLTGRNYLDMADADIRPLRAARAQAIISQPCGGLMHNRHDLGDGRMLELELLVLPIRPDDDALPMQLISVAVPMGVDAPSPDEVQLNIRRVADRFRFLDLGAGLPVEPLTAGRQGALAEPTMP